MDGAPLPQAEALPASIAALPLYQSHEVKHESFGRDVEALIAAIRTIRRQYRTSTLPSILWGKVAAGVALLALLGAGIWAVPTAMDWWEHRQPVPVKVGLPDREVVRWLKPGAGKTDWFKNCDDCPEMVVAPTGSFMMRSPKSEAERNTAEGPQHRVLPRGDQGESLASIWMRLCRGGGSKGGHNGRPTRDFAIQLKGCSRAFPCTLCHPTLALYWH